MNTVTLEEAQANLPELIEHLAAGEELVITRQNRPIARLLTEERPRLADAGIPHLSPILQQLVELGKGPEGDEYGRLRPTQYAFDKAVQLLVDAAILVYTNGHQVPYGSVSSDSEGGVRIEWVRDAASVHLIVPATDQKAAYVYHELGDDYASEDVTPERLSHWLRTIL